MLKVGQEILCRVDKISPRGADVTCVGEEFTSLVRGLIRIQDISDSQVADIREAFLPNDLVRAIVLSTGDAKSCFFSTVAPQCGVVLAKLGDDWLTPVDQSHMAHPDGTVYKRKVAKPM